ncbi:MAG: anhydro-N-acetylmuramic acid kinase [Bacteroidia bacterium]|nr:anhydro-N-acetylmuramic acid kinase [Bacteroidia bacterium]
MNTLALGVMSGTSLDGIDLALCRFSEYENKWSYEIVDAQTIAYPPIWIEKLKGAPQLKAEEFLILHNEYGCYTGELITKFLCGKEAPQLIASHGHTIFHQPDKKFTFQLGNGASIAASTGITIINDFRNLDVALGGQGAPLVPIGDQLLFPEFNYCLNIGGFANISFEQYGKRIAFDICPANFILNELALQKGYTYDKDGHLGASGTVNESLLKKLNCLGFYRQKWPKSLGREWIDNQITPLLSASGLTIEDQAATIYEHIANQISGITGNSGRLLATGGGSKNLFLMDKLKRLTSCQIVLPNEKLIDFKEALIFAFLGVLAFKGRINVLSSVTGSQHDNIGGTIYNIGNK